MTKKECELCYGHGRVVVHTLPDLEKPIKVDNVACPKCIPARQQLAHDRLEAENKRLRAQQAPLNGTINKLRRENERLVRERHEASGLDYCGMARTALAAAEAAGYRMVPDTPVAWTYPEELACMLDDPEHIGRMWSEPSGDGNDIALYAAAPEVGRD